MKPFQVLLFPGIIFERSLDVGIDLFSRSLVTKQCFNADNTNRQNLLPLPPLYEIKYFIFDTFSM